MAPAPVPQYADRAASGKDESASDHVATSAEAIRCVRHALVSHKQQYGDEPADGIAAKQSRPATLIRFACRSCCERPASLSLRPGDLSTKAVCWSSGLSKMPETSKKQRQGTPEPKLALDVFISSIRHTWEPISQCGRADAIIFSGRESAKTARLFGWCLPQHGMGRDHPG